MAELKRWLEEQLDNPNSGVSCVLSPYGFTFVRRSWFDGSLTFNQAGALLCVAAKLRGPDVYVTDVARFLGHSNAVASACLKVSSYALRLVLFAAAERRRVRCLHVHSMMGVVNGR